MEYAEVLLAAYGNVAGAIKSKRKNYFLRCQNSKYFYTPTDVFSQDLLDMLADCEKLIVLKNKLDVMFSRFSQEEKALLKFKYQGIRPKESFGYSLRTYFRKQNRLLDKVKRYLSYLGIDKETFDKDYLPIDYIEAIAGSMRTQKRHRNLSSVAAAFDIVRPKIAAAK